MSEPVSVRYARFFPVTALILGGAALAANLLALILGAGLAACVGVVPGALITWLGVSGWKREYFSYARGRIVIGALVGPITREVPGRRGGTIVADGSRIRLLLPDGRRRGAGVARWSAHGGDWARAVAAIRSDTGDPG
ncbi:hypothetical protein [Phytomonospora endophytica]|uniref:Uncharacterized protein n=1 Tax=Phytomonospora endophytica TaxID=714109 RepID=A0A841FNA2_9ACTN|nr:hypothetical protein [Phytomonospora endophytica]MBB6035278.1 hypothetical protein [Phytomonospora endophytica]GIG63973.1 hypothetical protein Pen01_02680 [Phytomonospora endophytica]